MLRGWSKNHNQPKGMPNLLPWALSLSLCIASFPGLTFAQAEFNPGSSIDNPATISLPAADPTLEQVAPPAAAPTILKGNVTASPQVPEVHPEQVLAPIDLRDMENTDTFENYDMTLGNLIRLIQNRNLDIAISQTGIEQAQGYLTQAFSAMLPSLQLYGSSEKVNGTQLFAPQPGNPSGTYALNRSILNPRMSGNYQINLGGKQIYQIKTSRYQLSRALENKNEMTQQALLNTLTQYFTLLRNTAASQVANQSLREASAQVMLNQKRLDSGFGTKLELMQTLALEEQRKSEVLQIENQKELSGIALVALLDLPITMRIQPEFEELKPIQLIEDNQNLEQLYGIALENRPDLKQAQFMIEEARARYGLARSDLFPTLGFSSYYQGIETRTVGDDPTTPFVRENNSIYRRKFRGTFELQANISMNALQGMGFDLIGDMKVQKAKIREAILNKEKQINEVQQSLSTAYQNSKLGIAQMRVAYQKMLAAQEEYRISSARLRAGMGINLDVIQAQKDLNDARLQYQDASLLYNKSQLQLLYETGQLTVNKLENVLRNPFPEVSVIP